jgi:hypothetical protein
MSETNGFDAWCIVQVMGHRSYGGRLSEREIAGDGFLQLDVPPVGDREGFTKLLSPKAIYDITPVTEEAARAYAARVQERPVQVWGFSLLPAPAATEPEVNDGDGDEDAPGVDGEGNEAAGEASEQADDVGWRPPSETGDVVPF